jgi:dipeptidyl aminopeptidase/acylaminoacyl peptidase
VVREAQQLLNTAEAPSRAFNMSRSLVEMCSRVAARLSAAGDKCELVTWENLDHYLEDSNARAQMLRKSEAFLRQALGM